MRWFLPWLAALSIAGLCSSNFAALAVSTAVLVGVACAVKFHPSAGR